MMSREKAVGYFAYLSGGRVVCDGDSCVIAGSAKKMKRYISELGGHDLNEIIIKKTRFREIKIGMENGAAYSFDEESYNRFYPMAQKARMGIGPENFSEQRRGTIHLIRVQRFPISSN